MKKILITLLIISLTITSLSGQEPTLYYIFSNGNVSYTETQTFYEFDVLAWINGDGSSKIKDAMIYFTYDTDIYGSNISENNKISITPLGPFADTFDILGELNDAYNFLPVETTPNLKYGTDTYSNTYSITIEAAYPSSSNAYQSISNDSNNPTSLIRFKLEVTQSGNSVIYHPNNVELDMNYSFDDTVYPLSINDATETTEIIYSNTGDPALPVTLESFIANYHQGAVELEWSTASETQNAGFVLKRALVNEGESLKYEVITSYLDNDDLTGAGTTTERHVYTYSDRAVRPGAAYSYILEDVDYSGNIVQHDPVRVVIPENVLASTEDFRLQPAYPNPFNPAFTVPFELHRAMDVRIAMYDLSGRQVRSIVNSRMDAGSYDLRVDASDLRSGIYFVRSIIGDQVNTQKMLLVK